MIGTTFYVMEPIDGFTPMGDLPGRYATDPAWRRRSGSRWSTARPRLGAVDPEAVGLGDFGKPEQLARTPGEPLAVPARRLRQFEGYGTPDIPDVDRVGAWLDANRPAEAHIGVIHGDYQFANVMLAPNEPKLAAIVDWELSTLGDPLLDLGWVLASWIEPGDPPGKAPDVQPWDGHADARRARRALRRGQRARRRPRCRGSSCWPATSSASCSRAPTPAPAPARPPGDGRHLPRHDAVAVRPRQPVDRRGLIPRSGVVQRRDAVRTRHRPATDAVERGRRSCAVRRRPRLRRHLGLRPLPADVRRRPGRVLRGQHDARGVERDHRARCASACSSPG